MKYLVLCRESYDPQGLKLIAVFTDPQEAEAGLRQAAIIEVEQANRKRRMAFESGEPFGRAQTSFDFDGSYRLVEVDQ
jgi:hypothetical protein